MRLSVSIISQIVWSAFSFIISILLVRYLSIDEYGWYAIILAVRQFALLLLGALVLTPVTVIIGKKHSKIGQLDEILRWVSKVLQLILILVVLLGWLIGVAMDVSSLPVSIFIVGSIATEMQRRICYINQRYLSDLTGGVFNL